MKHLCALICVMVSMTSISLSNAAELLALPSASNEQEFGLNMQRTMRLLTTSTAENPRRVRILCYGQSIVAGAWRQVERELRAKFPDVDLVIESRAIGGFNAHLLARTASYDVYNRRAPDLIIFHCYEGWQNEDYERIVANLRRLTTADILLFTHHYMYQPQNPSGPRKFQNVGNQDKSAENLRYVAQKYHCELVDVREVWKKYIETHDLEVTDLLSRDNVHLNRHGNLLLAALIARQFEVNEILPDTYADRIRIYRADRPFVEQQFDEIIFEGEGWRLEGNTAVGTSPEGRLTLAFEGNRVDIVAGVPQSDEPFGTAKILIDGLPPSANESLYRATRPTGFTGNFRGWPPLLSVGNEKPLIVEDWTFRITEISDDGKQISFEVEGSVTGHDGAGSNAERFVSDSGRVVIEPLDFDRITWLKRRGDLPENFEAKWAVVPMASDTYTPPKERLSLPGAAIIEDGGDPGTITVVYRLDNGPHTLEIIPNGDGIISIHSIIVHRPPLRDGEPVR